MTLTQGTKVRITCPINVNVSVFYNRDHDLYLTMTRIFSHFIVFQHIVSVFMASTVLFYSDSSCHGGPKKKLIWVDLEGNDKQPVLSVVLWHILSLGTKFTRQDHKM